MPQRLSTSRSGVCRRDRHKVYAAAEPHQEGEIASDISPVKTSINGGLLPSGSSRESSDRVGVPVDDRNCSHPAAVSAGNIGTVGPGAEPPVAVASQAFAHKEPHEELLQEHPRGVKQGAESVPPSDSFPGGEGVGVLSPEGVVMSCETFDRVDDAQPRPRSHNEKADCAGSRPESVNTNEGEADTLPDYFNLSDEYGPEGASTGRNQHDDDDDDVHQPGGPRFFGPPGDESSSSSTAKRRGRQNRPSSRRYSSNGRQDGGSSSGSGPRLEEDGGRVSASGSDHSEYWLSSSPGRRSKQRQPLPQQQKCFGRRTRQSSRRSLLTASKRNARIAPFKKSAALGSAENEGMRHYRPASSRSSTRYSSSPPWRHPRGAEDNNPHRRRRRGVSGNRSRGSRRLTLTETETNFENLNDPLEEEMARLRRENEALRQQQERSIR